MVRHFFADLLLLADPTGAVDMTPEAIARRLNCPLVVVRSGLKALSQPDPRSRSRAEKGRRIVLLDPRRDWGWQIVNFLKYRGIRDNEDRRAYFREAKRKQRSKDSQGTESKEVSKTVEDGQRMSRASTETEAETNPKAGKTSSSRRSSSVDHTDVARAVMCDREIAGGNAKAHLANANHSIANANQVPTTRHIEETEDLNSYVEVWNKLRGPLPGVMKLTSGRRNKLRTRVTEGLNVELFSTAIKICTATPFLRGESQKKWMVTFDWLIENDAHMVKIIEGNYGAADSPGSMTSGYLVGDAYSGADYEPDPAGGIQ